MTGVRFRADTGFEGQCDQCRQWWPLDDESWIFRSGFRKCRACRNETSTRYVRQLRRAKPEMRAVHRASSRANQAEKRRVNRDAYLEYQRRWWAANHVRLMAEAAERHLIKTELAGRKPSRTSSRVETAETLRYRADFRLRWIAEHGPIVAPAIDRREYNREWMRRHRAERAA